jgi:signal transduction histidine kinase
VRPPRLSISRRLFWGFLSLLVTTVILSGGLSILWFVAQQNTALDQFLGSEARNIAEKLEVLEAEVAREASDDPQSLKKAWEPRLRTYLAERGNLATPYKTTLLVLGEGGEFWGQSNRALAVVPVPGLGAAEVRFQSVEDRGPAYRSLSTTFALAPGHRGSFHLAVPLNSLDPPFYSFLTSLLVSLLGTFLVLSLLGAGLIRRTLQPVRRMAVTAGEISERHLDVRIPLPPGNDDLTRLAETLNRLLARLETEFGFQERLVAELTHQLKTPLALLRGRNELGLNQPPETRDLEALVQGNLSDIDAVVNLLNTVLELVRLDSHLDPISLEPVRIDTLVARWIADLGPLAEAKALHFLSDGPALEVPADPDGLGQILMNLYDNAWKFSPVGGTVLTTWGAQPTRGVAEIRVQNQGPPVPEEDLTRIFQRFYRGTASPEVPQGTGLGLAIVRSLTELHHGSVRAENREGGGVVFILELPLA